MRSNASKKQLKPPAILTSNELPDPDRSRNPHQSLVLTNPTPLASHTAQQDPQKLRIRGKTDVKKQKSTNLYNSLSATTEQSTLPQQQQLHGRTSFNTPLRGSTMKQNHPQERVINSTSKLTAVQLNQQQIDLEQQITRLSASFKQREELQTKSEKIRVAVRVRPFLTKELGKENVVHVAKTGTQVRVSDTNHQVEAQYDQVYPKESTQLDAYSFVQDCIPNLLQGFNCTIFAYGQTGSGKTYTMFGDGLEQFRSQGERVGIIPRCIGELFNSIRNSQVKYTLYCSFLQIYNEKLYDLLQDTYTKNPLAIREERVQGLYVEGLSEYVVQDELDCLNLLIRGEKNRVKRATKMNIRSSRSHTLFQVLLETDKVDAKGMLKRAKLNLGDLAGSEKVNKEEEMKAKHMLELRNINLSLTTLGKVIQLLSQGPAQHFPFRESKLTRLLQDSLGGNCRTYLIATVSPSADSIEETISTLKFADRAKCVLQHVKRNEINAKDDHLIQRLQKEVQYLKELLTVKKTRGGNQPPDMLKVQLVKLKDENERLRQMAIDYEDVERMKQENKQMRLELQRLRMIASDGGGSQYNPELSPRSFAGLKVKSHQEIGASVSYNQGGSNVDGESDTESIQEGFKNYKSELNFEVKLDPKHGKAHQAAHSTEVHTHRDSQYGPISPRDVNDIKGLRQQKDRLHQVLQEQQVPVLVMNKPRQTIQVKKRYKEGDLSDEGHGRDISLPAISETQISLQAQQYSKVELNRKHSNNDMLYNLNTSTHQPMQSHSPYSINRSNPLRGSEIYLTDASKPPISKYPNRNSSSIRRSMHEYPQAYHQQQQHQYQNFQGKHLVTVVSSDVNRSYNQLGSGGLVGLTTQSSLYGMPSLNQSTFEHNTSQFQQRNQSPPGNQTVVRIRGRYNQVTETKGSVHMTLDEEKRIKEKQKQLRRSNERLQMLETMEKARQEKVGKELESLMAEKARREQEDLRKREIIKQRKYVNANVGILGDGLSTTGGLGAKKLSLQIGQSSQ